MLKQGLALGLASLMLAGCAIVERTSPGMMDGLDIVGGDTPATETVAVRASGFTLLYLVTLISGDIRYDQQKHDIKNGFVLFKDLCSVADCYRTLQMLANDEKKELTNVTLTNNTLPSPGLTGWTEILGWFLETDDVMASGVLRDRKQK